MIIDAGEPGRDVGLDTRDDGWIAGEFVAARRGRIDETGYRQRDLPGAAWFMTYSGCEAGRTNLPSMTNEEIQPDTKDWTWVLSQRCPECGFTATDVDGPPSPAPCGTCRRAGSSALHRADAATGPAPTTWSTLEYGAHVRT